MFYKFILIFTLFSTLFIFSTELDAKEKVKQNESNTQKNIKQQTVLLIVASEGYMDLELNGTRDELKKANINIKIASSKKEASGMMGGKENVDYLLSEILKQVDQFDAIVFIGGPGCQEYFDNETAHKIAKLAVTKKKILAAICLAPNILAEAGVLKGKKATCYGQFINAKDVKVESKNVVRDGFFITGNGPEASQTFGATIVDALKEKK